MNGLHQTHQNKALTTHWLPRKFNLWHSYDRTIVIVLLYLSSHQINQKLLEGLRDESLCRAGCRSAAQLMRQKSSEPAGVFSCLPVLQSRWGVLITGTQPPVTMITKKKKKENFPSSTSLACSGTQSASVCLWVWQATKQTANPTCCRFRCKRLCKRSF